MTAPEQISIEEIEKLMDQDDVSLEILPDGRLKITESATLGEVVELIRTARETGDHY